MNKRAALLTDFSGFGKCAASIALPVLSMCSVEASVAPTCVLSSHTGGLGVPDRIDMTDHLDAYIDQWERIGAVFDAVSIGYLSCAKQAEKAERFLDRLASDGTMVLTDPVMADNGRLYTGFSQENVEAMRRLCRRADVITPNYTEGCLLTGKTYTDEPDDEEIERICRQLAALCRGDVVLTGIPRADCIRTAVLSRLGGYSVFDIQRINGHFHGCGDLFAACLLGCLLNGKDIFSAAQNSARFVSGCIADTAASGADSRFGLVFEDRLPGIRAFLGI